ncbi:MAG TPA: class I SAM-dependent methyltransferase [Microlunatus sp.]|nr:class I SAM-dependent methyltransferase [Microlunatus sp.]
MAQAYGAGFAHVYNQEWGGFASEVAPLIRDFYLSNKADGRRMLDIGCGAGHLARLFLESGFDLTGIDLSEPMLDEARATNQTWIEHGTARFYQADAAGFRVDGTFDLVLATNDVINHLPDQAALDRCFRSVTDVTATGGYFIFDLNTRTGLHRWNTLSAGERGASYIVQRGIYDGGDRAHMLITGFVPDGPAGRYRRFDQAVYNTAFDLHTVQTLLTENGWAHIHFARADSLATPLAAPELEGRVFVVAVR